MVYRVYVEKKPGLRQEAAAALRQLNDLPGVSIRELRLLNRYDVEGLEEALFRQAESAVLSEPQTDDLLEALPQDADWILAVESLPGQFDQRADSAAQCIQLLSQQQRPLVRFARVYLFYGELDEAAKAAVKRSLINPVECREAELAPCQTLQMSYDAPPDVPVLKGFIDCDEAGFAAYVKEYGLAMDVPDLLCCRDYFRQEQRDPSLTELRVLDTYWSDHCRHTTFHTTLDAVQIDHPQAAASYDLYLQVRQELGRSKPVNLMDLGTLAAKYLKKTGKLSKLDESPEINACTVKVDVDVDGELQPWLLLFKNETHNHPTEIEPFGGAATCLGGAIRDPLSGRSYVYQAMRLTGAADPLKPLSETIPGKLPQKKIVTTAAQGYSSYGNQIGLATGQVDEVYHPGYAAKRMEVGAVVGAAPAANVRREEPAPGDLVLLLGGRTGRDGCGGATGSSKSHTTESLATCGAEVQKGNPPEERKLQRLFRNGEAARLIKRCNDFGAGGVSVAIGELADGLSIDLDKVPKKYEGLDGTELAISESQERMALVVAPEDAPRMMELAAAENIETTQVAVVTAERRLVMRWRGQVIVDLSRDFLDTNGSEKHTTVHIPAPAVQEKKPAPAFAEGLKAIASDLNGCSQRGLVERFDSTIGAGTVLMPFGGRYQATPAQAMAAKLPVEQGKTNSCSVMSWGFDPYWCQEDPYRGAYLSVLSSAAKQVAAGGDLENCWLSFQEYFPKLGADPKRWGLPAAALLGAFQAQLDLGLSAIGGKDSMSGSFEQLDVPPTLISFAASLSQVDRILSPEFKQAGSALVLLAPELLPDGRPEVESMNKIFAQVAELNKAGRILSAYTPGRFGLAEGLMLMSFGNRLGCVCEADVDAELLFQPWPGSFLLEVAGEADFGRLIGRVAEEARLTACGESLSIEELYAIYTDKLESVYPVQAANTPVEQLYAPRWEAKSWSVAKTPQAQPLFLLPVFPGTNCELDTAAAIERAGGKAEVLVLRNLTPQAVSESVERFAQRLEQAQGIVIPGGFSGGDEPDGSGKFITVFFRNPRISEGVTRLLEQRDGLMAGICNGFQALIKLGLVPFGKILETDASFPTLTYNTIGRHQSRQVQLRIASNKSPWLARTKVDDIYTVPISHGEGRFLCNEALLQALIANGQIATQYVDLSGQPSLDVDFNPNGSRLAVEGITSPDGRVFGKMGHSERIGNGLYRNVPGEYDMQMFAAAVDYFRG
ncbi:MAG: phosphoribosylformylglycinamidine synthase [Firmicutes bacterium]|nr:phosphoribosylformylglycinamidine synthase [Bacillota bacterium]